MLAKLLVPILALVATSSCTTTPPQSYKPERVQPTEAMVLCEPALCKLRPEFANLELADQSALLLNCKAVDAAALKTCAAKHNRLVEWVKADGEDHAKR